MKRASRVLSDYRLPGRSHGSEYICEENNQEVIVGKENYFVRADGYLMPTKKDQPPPELKGFNRSPQ